MLATDFKEVVVTLYEKDYYLGVAALVNSLCNSNFDGVIHVGYRDKLPPWISQLSVPNDGYYSVGPLYIRFLKVTTSLHFGFYKPEFLKESFQTYSSAERIYYFDPDIVINSPWSFFTSWANTGVSLCLDNCFHYVHHNHPWRKEWKSFSGVEEHLYNNIDYYVNSGFIGLNRSNAVILDRWIDFTGKYKEMGGDTTTFEKEGYRAFKGDQDLLNAVITTSADVNFSIIGKEGMGFTQPSYLMAHAVMSVKPWKKNFLLHLFRHGIKPDNVEKSYFDYCKHPINIFPGLRFSIKKFNLLSASFIGRVVKISR